ncbi:hypothetical protein [Hydrogenophaga sp. RWCD_12]|uniref:hypothetical protein n=1 Tax=Hydrogenophaga sp. RWCD_12 TaxID=3391190 RepID=UPI0039855C6C
MRALFLSLSRRVLPVVVLCAALPALAQTGAAKVTPAESAPLPAGETKAIERISHEDALSRIEEVRVGGETRSIDVKPKNGASGYEIKPLSGADNPSEGQGSTGRSRWRILSF